MSSSQRLAEYQIEQVKGFILTECFHVGKFILSSNVESNYYIDCTPLVSTVVMRTQLARALHVMGTHSLKNKNPKQPISYLGMETRGIPFAMCAAYHAGVMFGILRKEQKAHGMENIVEHFDAVVNGILFDDVITTGDTIKKALEQAKMFRCYSIICIANRNDIKSINGVPVYSMLSQKELIKMVSNRLYFESTSAQTQKINTDTVTNP